MSLRLKQIVIGFGLVALLGGLALVILPMMVDSDAIKQKLISKVAENADLTLSISGESQVSLWPSPALLIKGIKLVPKNVADGTQNVMTAPEIQMQLGWGGILSGAQLPTLITLIEPQVQWSQNPSQPIDWVQFFSRLSGHGLPMSVTVVNGSLKPAESAQAWAENIQGQWLVDSTQRQVNAQFNLSGKNHKLSIQSPVLDKSFSTPLPAKFSVQSDAGSLSFVGDLRSSGADWLTQGKLVLETSDIWNFSTYWKPDMVQKNTNRPPLAMKMAGDVFHKSGQVVMKEMTLQGGETVGKISAGFSLQSPFNLQLRGEFKSLDIANLLALEWFGMRDVGQALQDESSHDMVGRIVVQADELKGKFRGSNLSLLVDMAGGELQISEARMLTEGEGKLIFQGDVKPSVQGPALSGNVSGDGKAFHQFLPSVMSVPFTLPNTGYGPYVFAATLRVTPEDLRISDFRARVESTLFNGAYIEQFDKNDAGIRVSIANLNVDDLLNAQASDSLKFVHKDDKGIDQTYLLPPYVQNILLGLTATNTLNIQVQDYTYKGILRDPADIELVAARGQATLKRLSGRFNGAAFNISGSVNVIETTPKAKLYISADDVDVQRFMEHSGVVEADKEGAKWSNVPLNWNFIPRADAEVRVAIGKLHHPSMSITDAKAEMRVSDTQIILDDFTANLWSTGQIKSKGQLSGGSLPEFKLGMSVGNVELAEARAFIPWLSNIAGRASFTSNLASNGGSALAMVQNAKGSLVLSGRAVQVSQFDLAGAVKAIRNARLADDVSPAFDAVLPASNTTFDTLEASTFLENGKLRLTQLVARNASYQGVMKGEGSAIDWTWKSTIDIPLPELNKTKPPVLGFTFKGAPDALETTRELADVQAYVADSTARQLIESKKAQ